MKQTASPQLMLVISMVVFGTLGLFVRNIPVSSGELALYRAILAALLLLVYFAATKQTIPFGKIRRELPLLLLSGVAMGFNWILLFEAYKYTTVSVATLSYYFAPVIVTVACPILFKEKTTGKQWICFAMSTLGIVLITGVGDMKTGSNHLLGIAFGLGAACFYAAVILLNKFIRNVEGIHRTFLQFIAAVLVLIPYVGCYQRCDPFQTGCHRLDLPAGGGSRTHRDHLLLVFLLAERAAGAKGGNFKLYRPAGGGSGIGAAFAGKFEPHANGRWPADSWLHFME